MAWKLKFDFKNHQSHCECFSSNGSSEKNKPSLSTTSIMDRQLLCRKLVKYSQQWKHKHWCFCCLQDNTWIKMPKWTIFEISFLSVSVVITEIIWQPFWRINWRSIIDVVERLGYFFSWEKIWKHWEKTKNTKCLYFHCWDLLM